MNIESKNFPDFSKTSIEVTIIFKKETKPKLFTYITKYIYKYLFINIIRNIILTWKILFHMINDQDTTFSSFPPGVFATALGTLWFSGSP